jgi:hypothetical protein
MNCSELFTSIGFKCRRLVQPSGEVVHCLTTPFRHFDGDSIHIFAEELDSLIRFFDGGDTLFHIEGSGIHFRDNRGLTPVKRLVATSGAELSDEGEISTLVPIQNAREGFEKVVAAVLAVSSWEAENAGITTDTTSLAAEVEFYLQQWKPGHEILHGQSMRGLSGRSHDFHFKIDGEFIDVVTSRPQSTAAELRKLADVSGVPSQADVPFRVIIDDRGNATRATQEAAILSRFADVWLLTNLQRKYALTMGTSMN